MKCTPTDASSTARALVSESAADRRELAGPKARGSIHPEDTPVADRDNVVFAGTVVSEGSGLALVTATGRRTELGRIRALIAETGRPSRRSSPPGGPGPNLVGVTRDSRGHPGPRPPPRRGIPPDGRTSIALASRRCPKACRPWRRRRSPSECTACFAGRPSCGGSKSSRASGRQPSSAWTRPGPSPRTG